jgi:lipoprotein-anchoring transpeptidase ErfK/SrfK
MAKGRHIHHRRRAAVLIGVAVVAGVALLVFGGAAFAAVRYEHTHADRIMPGVTVAGVDVSGMTREEAIAAVRAPIAERLSEPLTVTVGNDHWTVTPQTLGRRAAVAAAVRAAFSAGDDLGTLDRAWHRIRAESLGVDVAVDYTTTGSGIEEFAAMLARRTFEAPRDPSIGLSDDHNDIVMIHGRTGTKLNVDVAQASIQAAIADGQSALHLHTRTLAPKHTEATMGRTIVVRLDQNRLYLYDGFHVIRTFTVATAKPGFTTPSGVWTIYDKQVDPVWHNPALDSWGADLPAVIPGGPGNPMGPRAIYIDAPGLIRIHGTTDDSSIGRYASHGCIRMHNTEVIQLYPLIDVGEHVIVVGSRPSTAAYWSVPAPSDI